jgi:hypothetical protein
MLHSLWLIFLSTIPQVGNEVQDVIYPGLMIWVMASHAFLFNLNQNALQQLKVISPNFYQAQIMTMFVQALLISTPLALISGLYFQQFLVTVSLFLLTEIMCWLFYILNALTKGAHHLFLGHLLFIPMMWPLICLGKLVLLYPVVIRVIFGLYCLLLSLGSRAVSFAFRVGHSS